MEHGRETRVIRRDDWLAVIGHGRGGFKGLWASMTSFGELDEPCSRTAHRRGGDRVRYHMYAALYCLWFDLSSYLEKLRIDVEGQKTCFHVCTQGPTMEVGALGGRVQASSASQPSRLAFESTARDLLPKHSLFPPTTTPNHTTPHSHTHLDCRVPLSIPAHASKTCPPCSAAGSWCRCAFHYSHAYS